MTRWAKWVPALIGTVVAGQAPGQTTVRVWDVNSVGTQGGFLSATDVHGFDVLETIPAVKLGFRALYSGVGQDFATPANWSTYKGLSWTIRSRATVPVSIGFGLDSTGAAQQLRSSIDLKPGETRTVFMDLSGTAPAYFGLTNPIPVFSTKYSHVYPWSMPNLSSVTRWAFYLRTSVAADIDITEIRAHTSMPSATGWIDRFGQTTKSSWVGKVSSEQDLQEQRVSESNDLDANPGPNELMGTRRWNPTAKVGKWRVHRTSGGTSYFLSPEGRYFWSLGVVSVNRDADTIVTGRPSMFVGLPAAGSPNAAFYGSIVRNGVTKTTFNHYDANVNTKYGSVTLPWTDVTSRRLQSWGFNTLSSGSDYGLRTASNIPFTEYYFTTGQTVRLANAELGGSIADPFSSTFQTEMQAGMTEKFGRWLSNPRFMGIFVDGETKWGLRDGSARQKYGLALGALVATRTQPSKVALVNQLTAKYGTIQGLNATWQTTYASWEGLRSNTATLTDAQVAAATPDLSQFLKSFANTFYAKSRNAVRNVLPNGLYLGNKDLLQYCPNEALAAAEAYADVVSLDLYYDQESMPWTLLSNLRKPVLIAEFAIQSREGGACPSWNNPYTDYGTQAERTAAVKAVFEQAIRAKNVIGIHWWRYVDEPTSGKASNNENVHTGLVNVVDRPYSELVQMFRSFSWSMYQLRGL